ncbi:MAG TPA: sugar-binding protein [Planctomycetota bacterium]|jgi:hypothetical protein
MRSKTIALLSAILTLLPFVRAADDSPVFDVPKITGITIDGKDDDWKDQGLKVDALADEKGKRLPAANFSPSFRLGWDERGLLVIVTVVDDVALEPAEKPEELWKGDSVEFFVATQRGATDSYQVVIAPGRDKNHPELRQNISDYRKTIEKKEKLTIEVARTITPNGYIIEALLPWKNLNIEAAEGKELGFQLYANDSDKEGERFQALWYPKPDAHSDPNNMYRIKLVGAKAATPTTTSAVGTAKTGGAKITMIGEGELKEKTLKVTEASVDGEGNATVVVTAGATAKSKTIKVKDDDKTVGKGKLEPAGDEQMARIKLDKPKNKDQGYGTLTVFYDDDPIATIQMQK